MLEEALRCNVEEMVRACGLESFELLWRPNPKAIINESAAEVILQVAATILREAEKRNQRREVHVDVASLLSNHLSMAIHCVGHPGVDRGMNAALHGVEQLVGEAGGEVILMQTTTMRLSISYRIPAYPIQLEAPASEPHDNGVASILDKQQAPASNRWNWG